MEHLSKKEKRRLKREQRKLQQQSLESKKRQKSMGKKVLLVAVILLIVVGGGYGVSSLYTNPGPGPHDEFAQCLTDSGMKMYGAYWCGNCQRQKLDFGSSFQYIDYTECDPSDPEGKAKPEVCQQLGITGYPTWISEDGQRFVGAQQLSTLAEETGCELV